MSALRYTLLAVAVYCAACDSVSPAAEVAIPPPVRDPDHTFRRSVRSWKSLRQQNVVMQRYDYSCGAAALATLVRYYWGYPVTEEAFLVAILTTLKDEEKKDRMENGLSMTDLRKAAAKVGLLAVMGRRTMNDLLKLRVPVIVRIAVDEYEHFVVLRGVVEDRVLLADPTRGNIRVPLHKFARQWIPDGGIEGIILVVADPKAKQLPKEAPLLVPPPDKPLRNEMEAARRALFLQP